MEAAKFFIALDWPGAFAIAAAAVCGSVWAFMWGITR